MSYWLIAVPNKSAAGRDQQSEATKNYVDEQSAKLALSTNYVFRIPDLKVGTMDSLMSLSEEMTKIDQIVGSISKKVERAFQDTCKSDADEKAKDGADAVPELKVDDLAPLKYIEKFKWNQVRYPKRANIKQLVETILKESAKADEELKKHQQEYNDVKSQYSAIERKETGTMLVKPLNPYVKKEDIIETERLTTLLIVVPRSKELEFWSTYEILEDLAAEKEEQRAREREAQQAQHAQSQAAAASAGGAAAKAAPKDKPAAAPAAGAPAAASEADANANLNLDVPVAVEEKKKVKKGVQTCKNVVPRSAKKLADVAGDEFVLFRIVVFKKGADTLKNLCREKRYTVRAFAFDAEEEKDIGERKKNLLKQKKKLKNFFVMWSKTTFSEVFSAWVHLKAMRVFVEAVLRFGLPVNFLTILLEPKKGSEKNLRTALGEGFKHLQPSGDISKDAEQNLGGGDSDISGMTSAEFYPYVYVPIEFKDN